MMLQKDERKKMKNSKILLIFLSIAVLIVAVFSFSTSMYVSFGNVIPISVLRVSTVIQLLFILALLNTLCDQAAFCYFQLQYSTKISKRKIFTLLALELVLASVLFGLLQLKESIDVPKIMMGIRLFSMASIILISSYIFYSIRRSSKNAGGESNAGNKYLKIACAINMSYFIVNITTLVIVLLEIGPGNTLAKALVLLCYFVITIIYSFGNKNYRKKLIKCCCRK